MIPRLLAREFRDFPVTLSICLLWVAVFCAMTFARLASATPLSFLQWLVLGFGAGEGFGDLTLNDLLRGQVWRLMTCNFVHFSLLHIALNLLAIYQIGSIVESWYGPCQLVFIYGLTGGIGNLVSALIRLGIGSNRNVYSAGGSVVIMGLVALCAVAGWKARSPVGKWLSRQMVIALLLTMVVGLLLPNFIDNWGHAGGAIVGAAVGLSHRSLRARVTKPSAVGDGVVMGLIIAACAAAQVAEDLREARDRLERSLIQRSGRASHSTTTLVNLRRVLQRNGNFSGAVRVLHDIERIVSPPVRAEIRRLQPLVQAAQTRRLSAMEGRELKDRLTLALRTIRREHEELQGRLGQVQSRRRIGPWLPPPAARANPHS